MRKHIKYLIDAETKSHAHLRFQRTGENTICISTVGYSHMEQSETERELLKLKCRYDFDKGVQKFDSMCGRTFTHFTEPKGKKS